VLQENLKTNPTPTGGTAGQREGSLTESANLRSRL
jgi:hypothetical protein